MPEKRQMPAATVKTAGDRENPVSFVFLTKRVRNTRSKTHIYAKNRQNIREKTQKICTVHIAI